MRFLIALTAAKLLHLSAHEAQQPDNVILLRSNHEPFDLRLVFSDIFDFDV